MTAPAVRRVERDDDGHPVWVHTCDYGPGALPEYRFTEPRIVLPLGPAGWSWTDDGGLTPSILCGNCGTHGFWIGGDVPYWRPC